MKLRWWSETRHSWAVDTNAAETSAGPHTTPIWVGINETWNGGAGNDTHTGTKHNDTLDGMAGNDTIHGGKGDDVITGGANDDALFGDAGNDTIHAGNGTDTVDGGTGDDTIVMDAVGGIISSLVGGDGFDTLDATAVTAFWQIQGTSGIEHWILSDFGESFTIGVNIDETWEGRGGDDFINSAGGNDTLLGGEGSDVLVGGTGDDTIDGGNGLDVADFEDSAAGVTASLKTGVATGNGTDALVNIESLIGSTHNDHLTGGNGDDGLEGLDGNDVLDGGKGVDTAYYNYTSSPVTVNLATGTATEAAGTDTLQRIENVVGGNGNDSLTGDVAGNSIFGVDGADTILGGDGNDFLFGGNGNDTLTGGDGTDVLYGGAGADHFVFAALAHANVDNHLIADLELTDTIDLSAIDAKTAQGGDQAFHIVAALTGHAGEAAFFYDSGSDQTFLMLDTNGDFTVNFGIVMPGDHHTFSNFVL